MTYVVVKQGVYIQGVYGPYSLWTKARLAAQELARADSDAYHDWTVMQLTPQGLQEPHRAASYRGRPRQHQYTDLREAIEEDRRR